MRKKMSDVRLALQSANAFLRHSKTLTDSLGDDLNVAASRSIADRGEFVASATFLSLALEIYLKSLYMFISMEPPETHHLWSLFRNLPKEMQEYIGYEYDRWLKISPNHERTIVIALFVGQPAPTSPPDEPSVPPRDIKHVLREASNAFQTWRYFYEQGEVGKFAFYRHEYGRLGLVGEILRELITTGLTEGKIVVRIKRKHA